MMQRILTILLLPALSVPAAAGQDLGSVRFPVTCNAEAQAQMHRAVAMLHSFWFPEARKAFERVAAADSGCGMAYWGVAMTHFGNPMAGGSTGPGQASGSSWTSCPIRLRPTTPGSVSTRNGTSRPTRNSDGLIRTRTSKSDRKGATGSRMVATPTSHRGETPRSSTIAVPTSGGP